jgi:hypothetical protein
MDRCRIILIRGFVYAASQASGLHPDNGISETRSAISGDKFYHPAIAVLKLTLDEVGGN